MDNRDVRRIVRESGPHPRSRAPAAGAAGDAAHPLWLFLGHEHLRGPTARLELKDRAGRSYRLGGPQAKRWRLVRKGPLAVTLAGDSSVTPAGRAAVVSHIELDFPVSRSWSRLDWSLKDSDDEISELSLVVDLNLDPPRSGAPTLADFGAGTWVYARLARRVMNFCIPPF